MSAPFLKWAGGKRYLAEEILKRLPKKIDTYYEPMVGAGAVFFELENHRRFKRAKLNDVNKELITTYRGIRDDLAGVVRYLARLEQNHKKAKDSEKYYYKVRARDNLHETAQAARMIYLNRTCFNGLYRVNKSGGFNVPCGKYANPTICNRELLTQVHNSLQHVRLTAKDFESFLSKIKPTDALYFDPPYWPVDTNSFTSYTSAGFNSSDQARLANLAQKLKKKGVFAVFSNADVPPIHKLYAGLHIDKVLAPRRINSKGDGRGKITELLISTRDV